LPLEPLPCGPEMDPVLDTVERTAPHYTALHCTARVIPLPAAQTQAAPATEQHRETDSPPPDTHVQPTRASLTARAAIGMSVAGRAAQSDQLRDRAWSLRLARLHKEESIRADARGGPKIETKQPDSPAQTLCALEEERATRENERSLVTAPFDPASQRHSTHDTCLLS
jgi:hypothetical protein